MTYARAHGLSVAALYPARKDVTHRGVYNAVGERRQAPSSAPVKLVPVRVREAMAVPSAGCVLRVVLANGLVIEVPEHAELSSF
ncbi:MAG: hypothetical protein ACI8PT_003074 [Gammaproteobacteria bacterium]